MAYKNLIDRKLEKELKTFMNFASDKNFKENVQWYWKYKSESTLFKKVPYEGNTPDYKIFDLKMLSQVMKSSIIEYANSFIFLYYKTYSDKSLDKSYVYNFYKLVLSPRVLFPFYKDEKSKEIAWNKHIEKRYIEAYSLLENKVKDCFENEE